MDERKDRLELVAEDIEFVEQYNDLTRRQRTVIHEFELLMIGAEMLNNIKLFSIYRYRLLLYLKSENLKCRPLNIV